MFHVKQLWEAHKSRRKTKKAMEQENSERPSAEIAMALARMESEKADSYLQLIQMKGWADIQQDLLVEMQDCIKYVMANIYSAQNPEGYGACVKRAERASAITGILLTIYENASKTGVNVEADIQQEIEEAKLNIFALPELKEETV